MCKNIKVASYILAIIGAINWGFIGWLNFNLVHYLLGALPLVERGVYALVGFAALVSIASVYMNYKEGVCAKI